MLQSSVIHAPIKRWLKPNKPIPWLVAPEYPQVSMFLCHVFFGGHTPACLMMFDSKGENYSSGAEWSAEAVDLRMGLSQAWEMIRNWEVTNQNQGMSWYSYWSYVMPETSRNTSTTGKPMSSTLWSGRVLKEKSIVTFVFKEAYRYFMCIPPSIVFWPDLQASAADTASNFFAQEPHIPMMKDSQFAGDLHGVMDPLLACWQAGLIVASLSPGSWDDASPLDTSWVNHGWVDREVIIHVLPEME